MRNLTCLEKRQYSRVEAFNILSQIRSGKLGIQYDAKKMYKQMKIPAKVQQSIDNIEYATLKFEKKVRPFARELATYALSLPDNQLVPFLQSIHNDHVLALMGQDYEQLNLKVRRIVAVSSKGPK